MISKVHQLNVSTDELTAIEAALHTQAKILSVQAKAGSRRANGQLNEIKRALATVTQQKPCEPTSTHRCKPSWFGMSRIFG